MTHETPAFDAQAFTRRFNAVYARHAGSAAHRAIFREVYGADYPEEAAPLSYVTLPLLRRLATALNVPSGARVIDLGCGRGGPGLWVAREIGASLVGLDLASVAVADAADLARAFGLAERACFEVGDLAALPFEAATFDGALSVDALWMVPDRAAALREAARVLRSGARFVFTSWDKDLAPPGTPALIPDHRPLLRDAGFVVEAYEEVAGAEERRRAIYQLYLEREPELRREMGDEAAQALLLEARRNLGALDGIDYIRYSRRVFVAARKD